MKLQPIVDQLQGCGLNNVAGLLELAAVQQAAGALPAGYVVPDSEDVGGGMPAVGTFDQRVVVGFMVVLRLPPARNERVTDDMLDTLSKAVRGKLCGWTPPEMSRPIVYAGGRLLSVSGQDVSWGLRFRTAYHQRKQG